MKNRLAAIVAGLFCVLMATFTAHAQRAIPQPIEGRYLIMLDTSMVKKVVKENKRGKTQAFKLAAMAREAKERIGKIGLVTALLKRFGIADAELETVMVDAGVGIIVRRLSEERAKKLRNTVGIESVSRDFTIQFVDPIMQQQTDPIMQRQTHPIMQQFTDPIMQVDPIMQNQQLDIDTASRAPVAVTMAGGPVNASKRENVIWILDTGVDPDHPQLNVVKDTMLAKSFVASEPDTKDYNGHGTHCAGIAAASVAGNGVAGVSAGARIVPVKVLNGKGNGTWSSIISGLNHVAIHALPGDVVNMSFGASNDAFNEDFNPLLTQAVKTLGALGVYVVMSAGNDGTNASLNLPGLINGPNIYTIASMTKEQSLASYSNYGVPPVDFIVVGSRITSTWPGSQFRMLSGTSMAAALFTGVLFSSKGNIPANGGRLATDGKGNYIIATVSK